MAGRGRGAVLPAWMTAAGGEQPSAPGAPAAAPQRPVAGTAAPGSFRASPGPSLGGSPSSLGGPNRPSAPAVGGFAGRHGAGPSPAQPVVVPTPALVQAQPEWTEHTAPDGRKYYYNKRTGTSSWVRPPELGPAPAVVQPTVVQPATAQPAATQPATAQAARPAAAVQPAAAVSHTPWKEFTAPDGRKYYYNHETKESRWTRPAEMDPAGPPLTAAPAATRPPAAAAGHAGASPTSAPTASAPRPAVALSAAIPAVAALPAARVPGVPVTRVLAPAKGSHKRAAEPRGLVVPAGALVPGPPRDYATPTEARAAFLSLLSAAGVDAGMRWEDVSRALSSDHRFGALKTAGERRSVFHEHAAALRKEEAQQARKRRLAAKAAFLEMLDGCEPLAAAVDAAQLQGLAPVKFSRARDLLELEPRWQDVDGDAERQDLFDDWAADRGRARRERDRAERRERGKAFAELLRRTPEVTAATSWRRAQADLRDAPELADLDRTDALVVFEDHVRALEAEQREAEAKQRAERRAAERAGREALQKTLDALRAAGTLNASTRWRDLVDGPLRGDPGYEAVAASRDGSRPKELFLDVLEELEEEYARERAPLREAVKATLAAASARGEVPTEEAVEEADDDAPSLEGAAALAYPGAATPEAFLTALDAIGLPDGLATVATRRAYREEVVARASEEAERRRRRLARARDDLVAALREAGVERDTAWERAVELGEKLPEWVDLPDDAQRRRAYDELVELLEERARRRERDPGAPRRGRSHTPPGSDEDRRVGKRRKESRREHTGSRSRSCSRSSEEGEV